MIGQTIGNYRVSGQLGAGGMGVVYLAEHPALGRKAAIKVLHARLAADPEVVSRFFHEARASTAIRHPNIVEAYDYGTLPDGTSYIVMEYLEGESLAARLARRGALPLRTALDFTCQAAGALAAAHAKEIVHRDLKPDNLFVTPDPRAPGSELLKILDFGIAKLAASVEGEISHKTRTGTLIGTPLYMSPEQCLGVREVDARTDVYSLGCILYEVLSGRPPFMSEGFGALINMHINKAPEPLTKLAPDVPAAVERVVMKMLAKTTDDRVQTMTDVIDALVPELARAPDPPPAGATEPGRRVSRAVLNATTLSAAASTAVGPTTGAATGARRPRRALGVLALGGAAALGAIFLVRARSTTAPVVSTGTAPEMTAPAAPKPVMPTPATEPALVEAMLESTPPGALVTVSGVVIGTTPMKWRAKSGASATTLTFRLDGYRPETITALPSEGLRLSPTLKPLEAARPSKPSKRIAHPVTGPAAPPLNDIKSER